jgi:hypothetical protein
MCRQRTDGNSAQPSRARTADPDERVLERDALGRRRRAQAREPLQRHAIRRGGRLTRRDVLARHETRERMVQSSESEYEVNILSRSARHDA